mgnify:FL=1
MSYDSYYNILNLSKNANINDIKKAYRQLSIKFHPDKNSNLEEDIYYHIIIAGQILLNNKLREEYDEYLNNKSDTYLELKNNFNNLQFNKLNDIPTDNIYEKLQQKMNKNHGYNIKINDINPMEKFITYKSSRKNDTYIPLVNYNTTADFNDDFKKRKSNDTNLDNQIIQSVTYPLELNTYITTEQYSKLDDIEKLYINDSVQSSNFTSLDKAFLLHPELNINENIKIEDKIKNYNNDSIRYNNMNLVDYSKIKFSDWYS